MKTKEELNALKEEVAALNAELDEDELKEVIGGFGDFDDSQFENEKIYNFHVYDETKKCFDPPKW